MVHQWGFFGSISAIRKIWSLTANSRSLQAAALKASATLQDRARADRTSACVLNKNPYKLHVF